MPRQKRALDETEANAQPAAKRSSTEKSSNAAAARPARKQASTTKSTEKVAEKAHSTEKPAQKQTSISNAAKKPTGVTAANGESTERPVEPQLAAGNAPDEAVEKPSEDRDSAANENAQESSSSTRAQSLENKPPGEYICIDRPFFDFVAEREDKEVDEEGDDEDNKEDDEERTYEAYIKETRGPNRIWPKPAAEHPDWKWVMMVKSWKEYCELRIKQTYVDPDNFDMYVFNDFYGYGINSMIENMLSSFDKAYKKKQDRSLQDMWILVTTLIHWLNVDETIQPWLGIDDGDRVTAMVELAGCAFLSVLDIVDNAKELKPDSTYRDLGLVMSLYLKWSKDMPVLDDGALNWREHVVAYAKKGGIDLKASGCYGNAESLEELGEVEPLQNKAVGRWKWTSNYNQFKRKFGFVTSSIPYGLPCYDITKWPRKLRAKSNFDHVDPLGAISDKDLKEGNILIA